MTFVGFSCSIHTVLRSNWHVFRPNPTQHDLVNCKHPVGTMRRTQSDFILYFISKHIINLLFSGSIRVGGVYRQRGLLDKRTHYSNCRHESLIPHTAKRPLLPSVAVYRTLYKSMISIKVNRTGWARRTSPPCGDELPFVSHRSTPPQCSVSVYRTPLPFHDPRSR